MSLDNIRKEIDKIDNELAELLRQRMECSLKVAEIKRAEGLPVYHPGREAEIIKKVSDLGGNYGEYIGEIYRFLMACSREVQHNSLSKTAENIVPKNSETALNVSGKVACYGNFGAFTHLALMGAFGEENVSPLFFESFDKVFGAVDRGEVKFGILPIENSSAGSVREVYDLLLKSKAYIAASVIMPIKHNLLGLQNAEIGDIKTVYSHGQAISQCKDFINAHRLETVEYYSTANAAKYVAELNDKSAAAIGSAYCGKYNGLKVISENIQSFDNNKTRFILISKTPVITNDREKISITFSLPHTPGSLQKILTRFSLHGLNLTKLESCAGTGGGFETRFYLDFLGDAENEKTKSLLLDLTAELKDFAFLGNYKEYILN